MSSKLRAIRKEFEKRTRTRQPWVGLVGDANGVIEVPGQPNLWYVRAKGSDLPIIVRGGGAPMVANTEVLVGRDPYRRNLTRVLGLHYSEGAAPGESQAVEAHAASHAIDGSDPIWLVTRQITNGLVYAAGGMTVGVHKGWIIAGGQALQFGPSTLDLTSHIPVSGARYALVRVSASGVVSIQDGTPVASLADLTDANIPAAPADCAVIAVIRLYYGQTALSRLTTSPDVMDVRFATRTNSTGGVGSLALDDLTDVDAAAPADGQALVWDAGAGAWVADTLAVTTYWEPVTDGDTTSPELIFDETGDVIVAEAAL